MTSTILKNESREAWLAERQKGIGGTDISAIIGVNKFKTPFDVWEDKTGRAPKFEGNKHTKRGQYMEDAVANYFEDVSGHRVIRASETDEMLIHNKYPFLLGSPDRRYFAASGGKGVLECKTTMQSFDENIESIPQAWFVQLQWYLGLTGYKQGTIAWAELGYNSDFKSLEIEFNPDFFDYMVAQGVCFWNNYIMTDTPPPAVNSEDVEKMFKSHTDGKFITATPEFYQVYEELKEHMLLKKAVEADIERCQEAIKMAMGDAEGAKYGDQVLATWKTSKGSVKFDDKALKEADPDTWAKFTKEVAGSRRFVLK